MVDPPSAEETVHFAQYQREIEDFHNVTYSDDAVVACVKLSERYISDRFSLIKR